MVANKDFPHNNGAVHIVAKTIKALMSLMREPEIGAMYITEREVVPIRKILIELGHDRPTTPMQTDKSIAHAVITKRAKPLQTKAMDMRL